MNRNEGISRRELLQLGAGLGAWLGLNRLSLAQTAMSDYRALVCVFLFGGNDGHNTLVPLDPTQYAAYSNIRGNSIALPKNALHAITDSSQGDFGLHPALSELRDLYDRGVLAVLANVGTLVRPTSYAQSQSSVHPLPLNLRSHSDQVAQMQTAIPDAVGGNGWGGRAIDLLVTKYGYNAGSTFPAAIGIGGPALFCNGASIPGVSLQPGNFLQQNALNLWPASAAQARSAAQAAILAADSGNSIIDAANRVLKDARILGPLLQQAAGNVSFTKAFPPNPLGDQLKEVARVIALRSQLGVGRQVFFCSLGGFDTHAGQGYQQDFLLGQVSPALDAFYAATEQLFVENQVTTFTLSDFGRTLQPSGSGSDHGWGNHHFILGGAVQGGQIYGRMPLMSNYQSFNASAEDYADVRGTMLPSVSHSQYAATLARWFGAPDPDLDGLIPTLTKFTTRDLGFLA